MGSSEEAEEAIRAKDRFLATMSHEIRTPIHAVIGLTELCLETDLSLDQREMLTMIRESTEALRRIVDDVLDFSKIEAGKLALESEPMNLRDCLESTVASFALPAFEKGIELVADVPRDVPEEVLGDAGRLRQILTNLVANAVKFTEAGEVAVRAERIAETPEGVRVRLSVLDTGIGIPEEKQALVFEPFVQADGSTTRRFGGTGLGLAVSRELVSLMGGTLEVESEPGRGSTFRFEVSFERPARTGGETAPWHTGMLSEVRVLVVDDNRRSLGVLSRLLRSWGMSVEEATTADVAWRLLTTVPRGDAPFQVLLLDETLPGGALELARRVREDAELRPSVVLLLSSADEPDSRRRAREAGVSFFVSKPIRHWRLLAELARSVDAEAPPTRKSREVQSGLASVASRSLRVLVAEDWHVNQEVLRRLLLRWGHEVVLADDGAKAVRLATTERFDAVLMDVEMPGMGGLEAARRIREHEASRAAEASLGRRTPIVAVTAHALSGESARCIEAGMDAYLPKPLRSADLFDLLERLTSASGAVAAGLRPPSRPMKPRSRRSKASDGVDRLDLPSLLAVFAGQEDDLLDAIEVFERGGAGALESIERAVESGDAVEVERTAHRFKGFIGLFGRGAAFDASRRLEEMGRQRDLGGAAGVLEDLARSVSSLRAFLATARETLSPRAPPP